MGKLLLLDSLLQEITLSQDAARDQGDQRLPSEGEEEGRQEREDQEECGQPQVQGQVLKVPLHPQDHGQGEGRKAEAVSSSGSAGQGAQVKRTHVILMEQTSNGQIVP